VCTFSLPKAELLALLLLEEAVVVSFTAAVDEGPAGLNLTIKVPAQSVLSTVPLLHGQQAQVSWSYRTQTCMCAHAPTHTHTQTHTSRVCTQRHKDAHTIRKEQARQRGAEAEQ